ncbi:hypothetical protein [Parasitella parasitica]|uniref:DNA helicase n=1 Tax=Parasitella parasitica TaxID=35722 RepID=A0A0B7MX96_9FUNG|nr:hypothetical protein [Parasitella parasitica]
MSNKRPRDQDSIDSLKAILGDLPATTINNLLQRSNYNVEVAVNLYFAGPQQETSTATKSNACSSIGNSKLRYYIGDIVITGWSLVKGRSPVNEGDRIKIVRDRVVGSSTNKIVRFSKDGKEVGRLPKDVASYMSILIDQKICEFEGAVVWSPPIVQIGGDVILSIKCYITAIGMHSAGFIAEGVQHGKKKRERSIQHHEVPAQRKTALLQMFRNLGLNPVRSAIQKMSRARGGESWDTLLQSVAAIDAGEKRNDASSQEDDNGEEAKAVTDKQLDTIYEKAQMFDSQIKPSDTPFTMALELKEYQKRALAWMCNKESYEVDNGELDMRAMHPLWEEYTLPGEFVDEHRFFYFSPYSGELSLEFPESNRRERGGILADEMGLGKTIEMLSLIHTNRYQPDKTQNPTLFGKKSQKSPTTLIVCPVSLLAQWRDEILRGSKPGTITVEVFYGDVKTNTSLYKLSLWDSGAPDVLITTYGTILAEWNKIQEKKEYESVLFGVEYWRVVLDEAHQIKNKATRTSQACRDIKAKRRWALTGTPIQNKLDDLFALIRYLHFEPWSNSTFWKTFITIPFERQDSSALTAVQTVLEPILLRRTKAMRDQKGQPMVPLPRKTINIEYLPFTAHEQDIYDAIYSDSQIKFSYYCEAGRVGNNYASIFQLLTRLRQTCCHPYLALQTKETVQQGIKASQEGGEISLENLIQRQTSSDSSQMSSQRGNGKYGLSVLQNMLAMQDVIADECPICFEIVDVMIGLPCMHFACRPCIMDYLQVSFHYHYRNKRSIHNHSQKKEDEGLPGECPVCRHGPILQSQLLEFTHQKTTAEQDEVKQQQQDVLESKRVVKYDIKKAVGGYKVSTKINALIRHLQQNRIDNLKTVVFSQFTSFLDLIGDSLNRENILFTRLDGSMPQAKREKVLSSFSKEGEGGVEVLLISLRAGGVGLNLTCANRVIMMDPWWNFAIEAQAIDRVHRLGQSKDVVVTRFVMKDSVEERILEIQNRKHALVNELYMSRDQSKNRKLEDLQILFRK